ncbi:MAG: hypothetical protein IKR34_03770, partial [Candidatus Gastranaerophilales bacterium]|nr:hypothetical protein [Candidatus Gastranaerophilales bacterium]
LNVFLKTVRLIEKTRNDVQFVFSHANSLSDNAFKVPYKTIKNENHQLLAYSDFLILASGTVALEASIYETPMIIAYRGPLFFYLVYLLVRNIKKACLVNIITGKDYVDEFIMFDANPNKMANAVNNILDNKEKRDYIIKGCRETKELLNKGFCAYHVASIIKNDLDEEKK